MKRAASAIVLFLFTAPLGAQERPSVAPRSMQAIAPDLADYTDRVLFGDVWERAQLSPRDRSLVTLSALIATGKTPQLTGHLNRGLSNGLKPGEVAGMVTQLAFYTGWPNAVSALEVIEKTFVERKIDTSALRTAAVARTPPVSDPEPGSSAQIASVAPKFAELTNEVIFGDLWRRTDLSPRDRSLVTIAALAANGDAVQLDFHIRRGLENGLTRQEIGEAFTHLAFYAGWPRASTAIAVAGTVFAQGRNAPSPSATGVQLFVPGESPVSGPSANFTGSVTVTSRFRGTGDARLGGATVAFQPGARTNWHRHPLGQLLIVTEGTGWIQAEGGPVRVMKPGDVVWTGPRVKHWHGATRASGMTHVAVADALEGESVTWLDPVTDAQYRAQ